MQVTVTKALRVLYTHRTQGVGAEGAHVLGMYEAFADLGHSVWMDCLPGCNPAEAKASPPRATRAPTDASSQAKPKAGSVIQKLYWFIADHAPQMVFEAVELSYNVPLFLRLCYKAWRFKPDLIYERYALNTFAPTWVALLLGCRHVLEVNDSVVIHRSRPLRLKRLATAIEGHLLKHCQLAITITAQFREQLLEKFRVPSDRIVVLTNGVSVRRFKGPFERNSLRASLGVTGTVLGSTGQFLPWHGLKDLLEYMGPMAKRRDLHFVFVGDGPVRAELEALAQTLGFADRLHITGMVPIAEVPQWLSVLDIAVIPQAAPHASPMKLMEYMAMGLPIVAPELPSIRAAMPVEGLGFLFTPNDLSDFHRALEQALADAEEAMLRGRKAKQYVMEHLTWTAHAREVLQKLGVAEPTPLTHESAL